MATIQDYFGLNAGWGGVDGGIGYLNLDADTLADPTIGRFNDVAGGFPDTELEKLIIAVLNTLYEKSKSHTDDPDWRIVGSSVFQGRQTIGLENPILFDTYDLTFQIRLPSNSGAMPDPDTL